MNAKHNLAAERQYGKDVKALEPLAFSHLSPISRRLLDEAQAQARGRDDNHVGTEHIVLAIYTLGQRAAKRALESLGVTRELFGSQLHDEPGPSPGGRIPLTPRARMIVGLAWTEANRRGSKLVEPEHILLGAIRESQRWEATGMSGPQHLRTAANVAGTILLTLEKCLVHEMDSGSGPRY